MARTKIVNINIFYTCSLEDDGKYSYLPLQELFDTLKNDYESDKEYKVVKNYNFDPIRIKSVEKSNSTGYYHIIMERLDDKPLSKTTIYGESTNIELKDNEYIGHEISILYDPTKHVMLVQRNISSLSPSGVEKFIDSIYFDYYEEYANFKFVAAIDGRAKDKALNNDIYRSIALKVTGDDTDDLLLGISGNKYEGVESVEIIISTNRSKSAELDCQTSKNLLNRWVDDNNVEKLFVKTKETEDSPVEEIDLLKQALKRTLKYSYTEGIELNAHRIYFDMVDLYRNDDDAISLLV
uniref:DUF6731 family protein n=1 Tax=Nosocomiicoccus ampullae TaxID=489910 RepID=UPI00082BE5A2|nr:DUF6731 family protein [Nosocomiicoccus ampullae]